jgi:transcriptional regulator with XRE-family HTH domain
MATLAEKIKKLRKETNLTQEEFAKLIGISRPTFVQIEQGDRQLKQAELQKLAQIFEVSIDDFLRDAPLKKPVPLSTPETDPLYKFKQAFLYLLTKSAGKPNVGKTVLNKLLYFADFNHYEKYWKSITGVDYIKMPR